MTKDYKETNNVDTSSSGYGWMLSGIAMGLLVGLGMYFYANYKDTAISNQNIDNTQTSENKVRFGEDGESTEGAFNLGQTDTTNNGNQEPDPISVVIESARQEQQDRKRATFSYYAVLPNLELDVDVKPSEKDKPVESEATEKVILKPGTYVLQIASFKSEKQARRAQKKLTGKGLETRIEKRKVKGKYWFRVFAGPSAQQSDLDAWNAVVVKAGFKPLIINVQ